MLGIQHRFNSYSFGRFPPQASRASASPIAASRPPSSVRSDRATAIQELAKAGNGSADGGAKRRNSVTARAAAPEARGEVQNLQLSVDEPGLLAWGLLGKDWKKYLWILEAARTKGIDGLSNSEISYLMDKTFREVRAPKLVNNLKKKIKDRFVQPSTVNLEGKTYSIWRILADGSKEVIQLATGVNP